MIPSDSAREAAPVVVQPRRSLSWRLVWFTLAAMVATELLLFLPAMQRERQKWLGARIVAAHIAVQSMPIAPPNFAAMQPAGPDRAQREELLRLAGVMSVRLQEPGRAMVVLAPVGQVQAAGVLDLRAATVWSELAATLAALVRDGNRTLLVVAPSPKRPQAVLSIVLQEGELDAHLRAAAASVALHGLAVAIPTGVLVYLALLVLLVRPMRRLTDSIAAFRADPERTPPLAPPCANPCATPGTRDEIVVAQRELAAMQHELRGALWRNARLAALGAAVAKVSHDLRGILAPALLTAERLQGSADAAQRRSGDSIASAVARATELMRDTLNFAGEVPAAPREHVPLRDLVHEVVDEVRLRHPALRPQVMIDSELAVLADRAGMRRAVANLVRNAAEAGAQAIEVAATAEAGMVLLVVRDNGPGLPDSVRERLFQPFVTSGKRGGTGLGLAITRDLVRAQGGDVALLETSAAGTSFRVALRAA